MKTKTTTWKELRSLWQRSPTVQNILKVSIGDITSKIFSFAMVLLLIRGLSMTDYAAYTAFSGISVLFSGVIGTGINMALVRFASDMLSRQNEKPVDHYFLAILFQLILYLLAGGLCFAFPELSTRLLFGEPGLSLPLQLGLLAGLGMLIIQFTRSLYQAEEKFSRYIGILWLAQISIFLGLVAAWLLHSFSFVAVALIFVAVQFGLGLWILFRLFRDFRLQTWLSRFVSKKNEFRSFLIGSGWLIGYFLILNLFSRMDVLMLLRFRGPEELAVYGVAFQYYSLALLFLGSIHAVLLPKFSRAEMEELETQKTFLKRWFQGSIWLAIPIILFDVFGKPIFIWLNGSTYESAFPIFIIFSLGIWLSMIFSPLVNILISKRAFCFLFQVGIVGLCVNILLNLLLVPSLGGTGAAITVVISVSSINIFSFIRLQVAQP